MIEAMSKPQYLTREQVHALLDAAKPGRDRLFIRVAWETGARVSEILNLCYGNIGAGCGELYFGPDGTREVPISQSLGDALCILIGASRSEFAAIDTVIPAATKLFQFHRQTAWRIVRDAGRAAGLVLGEDARDITPEALPHSFAMNCILQDVPLAVVQQVMGLTPYQARKYGAAAAAGPARVREFLRKVVF